MKIHWFQHVPFEGLGHIEEWARHNHHTVSSTRFWNHETIPSDLSSIGMLIVMGGPMSANDAEGHTWLKHEERSVEKAIELGKPIVGICLGAQIIARILGARVYKNAHKEIGWFPVTLTNQAHAHPLANHFPAEFTPLHWHGETFDLPPGSLRLAGNAACENQGYLYGPNVVGLQFHLEATCHTVSGLCQNCAKDLTPGPFVQEASAILGNQSHYRNINSMMEILLEKLQYAGILH